MNARYCMLSLIIAGTVGAADMAPLYQSKEGLDGSGDWRALGPLLERSTSPDGRYVEHAYPRPFYTDWKEPDQRRVARDFLWPLGFSRRRGDKSYQFVFPFLHTQADAAKPGQSERWWLLPFVFHGYSDKGESYTAVFPVSGSICNLLGYDRVSFRWFPLWLETDKGDRHSTAVLWPFYSQTRGTDLQKRRVFPFWGYTRTPKERHAFYVWPFGHRVEQFPDSQGRRGSGFAVLPFYGRYQQVGPDGEVLNRSWTLLWPFFSGSAGTDGSSLRCPWPFYARGTRSDRYGKHERVDAWPFWGQRQNPHGTRRSVAWPFWQQWATDYGKSQYRFRCLVPFYWYAQNVEAGRVLEESTYWWPLAWHCTTPDRDLVQVLALWPRRHTAVVERNYAPFWTLYQRDRQGDAVRHDAIWGLWQMQRCAGELRRWVVFPFVQYEAGETGEYRVSLLGGLLGWGRDDDGQTAQALWFLSW